MLVQTADFPPLPIYPQRRRLPVLAGSHPRNPLKNGGKMLARGIAQFQANIGNQLVARLQPLLCPFNTLAVDVGNGTLPNVLLKKLKNAATAQAALLAQVVNGEGGNGR